MSSGIDRAIDRARRYLLARSDEDFAETAHTMYFSRKAGFRARAERHTAEGFGRAVLASILLDIAEMDVTHSAAWQEIARQTADRIAGQRLLDRAGGWSYFPTLAELPPDLDSLAAALLLFARIAPQHLPLCQGPVELALQLRSLDGGCNTWLVSPADCEPDRRLMRLGIERYWGRGAAVEVDAHFYLALLAFDKEAFLKEISAGARHIRQKQRPDGDWASSWYHGSIYGTTLCVRLLKALNPDDPAIIGACQFLHTSQRPDHGWGQWQTTPLETGLALWTLASSNWPETASIDSAVHSLLDFQAEAGHWQPSPWIRMEVGRARGNSSRTLTYQSATLTTAFCLRALLAARQRTTADPTASGAKGRKTEKGETTRHWCGLATAQALVADRSPCPVARLSPPTFG